MARQVRGGLAGVPYLLTQRVQHDQSLVRDDHDRQRLLDTMRMASQDHKVAVHAYAVNESGWWMLATPATPDGLSLMVQSVGRQYVGYYNRRHGRHGSLWASRYQSCVLASAQDLLDAVLLVESSNPNGAWSSAAHHLGRTVDPLVSDHAQFWTLGNTPFEREAAWRRRLEEGLAALRRDQLVQAATKGWALGAAEDVQRLQQQTERRLTPGKRGRPRKSVSE